jgi:hypothetical protein
MKLYSLDDVDTFQGLDGLRLGGALADVGAEAKFCLSDVCRKRNLTSIESSLAPADALGFAAEQRGSDKVSAAADGCLGHLAATNCNVSHGSVWKNSRSSSCLNVVYGDPLEPAE